MSDFNQAETIPATLGDLAILGMILSTEIVATLCPDSKIADEKLEDIASRLLDLARDSKHSRSRLLFGALAEKLVKTEQR